MLIVDDNEINRFVAAEMLEQMGYEVETAEDAVRTAAAEGLRVMGASNFHDLRIYSRFAEEASAAGIVPLFGVEFISVDDELQAAGTRVNDPANPGRVYLCGKGVDPFAPPTATWSRLALEARRTDADRMRQMVARLRACFAEAGLATVISDETIAEEVAERAGVPRDWVVLQERHVARAFQEALFLVTAPRDRAFLLARAFGGPSAVAVEDPVAVQGEIRSRLMKAGRPAFVEESPVSFVDAYRLVLELGGIPCYPTLADGADPLDLITKYMSPAMDEVGRRFECEDYFVPELLMSGRAMNVSPTNMASTPAASRRWTSWRRTSTPTGST